MDRKQIVDEIMSKRTFLCVGLDSDIQKLPKHLLEKENPIFEFNKAIIDATADHCVAYKPNLAFYESLGADGWKAFELTVGYLKQNYPKHLIIADAKRGDIGNTAKLYARSFFEHSNVDAITVAPYMGEDSVTPFLGHPDKWVVLLALTSNKGSHDFQFVEDANGTPLFETVMRKAQTWATPDELMFVVGATQGVLFKRIREIAPTNFLLVPGVGAQGGSLEEVAKYGMIEDCGLLVNSSRAIIYASQGEDFAEKAREAAALVHNQMDALLPKAK